MLSSDTTVLYPVDFLPWMFSFDAVWNWPCCAGWADMVADIKKNKKQNIFGYIILLDMIC